MGQGTFRKGGDYDRERIKKKRRISGQCRKPRLFHCRKPGDIVFTMNVTEALNLALQGILMEGDHVITSSIEHNAVWRCLKTLERGRGN